MTDDLISRPGCVIHKTEIHDNEQNYWVVQMDYYDSRKEQRVVKYSDKFSSLYDAESAIALIYKIRVIEGW